MRSKFVATTFAILCLGAGVIAASGSASAAGFECSKFSHQDDGSWRVEEPLEIGGPTGRIDFTPPETYKEGQTKKGLDVAKLLNMNCLKK